MKSYKNITIAIASISMVILAVEAAPLPTELEGDEIQQIVDQDQDITINDPADIEIDTFESIHERCRLTGTSDFDEDLAEDIYQSFGEALDGPSSADQFAGGILDAIKRFKKWCKRKKRKPGTHYPKPQPCVGETIACNFKASVKWRQDLALCEESSTLYKEECKRRVRKSYLEHLGDCKQASLQCKAHPNHKFEFPEWFYYF